MSDITEVLPHIRLQLNIDKPDFDDCYAEGYQCALKEVDELENPYPAGTPEYQFWQDGWWAGFYGEEPLFELAVEIPEIRIQSIEAKIIARDEASNGVKAVNDTIWTQENIKKWAIRLVKLTGFIAVVIAAYEISDLAA